MSLIRFFVAMLSAGTLLISAGTVCAQNYPEKPIRIVLSGAGTSTDLVARVVAQELTTSLGQQMIVENRPSVLIAAEVAAKAAPDGYLLLVAGNSLWVDPLLRKASYDALKDFAPISVIASAPLLLVAHSSVPVKSVQDLIALAKARPGVLNYAAVPASAGHLAMELFKSMAGVKITEIPYKSSEISLIALISGQIELQVVSAGSVAPYLKIGRLRALAVTGAQPSAQFPGLPTVAASGLPGYEAGSLYGIFAPAGTAETIINRLNQEVVRALNRPEVKEKLLRSGVTSEGSTPAQLGTRVKSEMASLGKLIKDLGIRQP